MILFATKTWGGDYQKFLSGAFDRKWQSCQYPFDDRWLMVNNGVPDETEFIPKHFKVSDLQWEALEFFDLTPEDFNGGFNYSIAELTAIYLAKDFDYLCWVQGDCLVSPAGDWVTKGIEVLKNDPNISVVSPGSQCNTWGEVDQYFSDQAFLIRVPEFRQRIYSYGEPDLPDFPEHGGDSFEKKCAQYLINEGKGRRILYDFNLEHEAW